MDSSRVSLKLERRKKPDWPKYKFLQFLSDDGCNNDYDGSNNDNDGSNNDDDGTDNDDGGGRGDGDD